MRRRLKGRCLDCGKKQPGLDPMTGFEAEACPACQRIRDRWEKEEEELDDSNRQAQARLF